jgi:hypothetical protein
MLTVAYARGRITGAAILTLFGSLWCLIALIVWDARPRWSIPAAYTAGILLLALCLQRFIALRKIRSANDPAAAAKGKRAGMWFGIIFGAEGLLIWLCAMLLQYLGLSIWIPIAVAVIVGLHFLPLARVFEAPLYYWTGAICVLGSITCSFIPNADLRVRYAAFVMAAVLWLTALLVLLPIHPRNVSQS